MRRGQVIGHAGLCARRDWQSEIEWPLSHEPHASGTFALSEELKPRQVRSLYLTRKLSHVLSHHRFREQRVGQRSLAKEACGLLPLAVERDVGIVAATEGQD